MTRALAVALALGLAGHALAAAPWEAPLRDGFEAGDFTPEGGLYYKRNYEQSAGVIEFQGAEVRTGQRALKLTVNPLCPKGDEACSERAEIWERPALRAPYDQGMWFGFAVKFDAPVPQDDHRYLIAQWKREIEPGAAGDFSPFLALRLNEGRLFATVETNQIDARPRGGGPCPEGQAQVWQRPDVDQSRALIATDARWTDAVDDRFTACTPLITVTEGESLPLPGSGWIDFAVYAKPGPGGDGRIEIFANDRHVVTVKGHIGHDGPGLGANQYFKFGPYRTGAETVWTMYYDDFRRGPRCADVMKAERCPF